MTEEHGTRPAARNNTGWRADRRWVTGQVEHTWEKRTLVVKASKPDHQVKAVLDALGVPVKAQVLSVSPAA